ncbi:hypothetical protein [Moorena sp. SIO4G3]|uniref:hypothetical protein n=1 Tax=Moorena sp. SIO4G3 TaxID=2607821 RepID=UPI00142A54F2|nr:hypothetical protein [Moorena sp. SIO4G3]NEO82336.1 hypothetical protein [Moorena sp. SIO4G3]
MWNRHLACIGHLGGMGILPVSGILVEWASCLYRASWWNGHLACIGHLGGTGILPVSGILVERASCLLQFPGGQDAHSTDIDRKIQQ